MYTSDLNLSETAIKDTFPVNLFIDLVDFGPDAASIPEDIQNLDPLHPTKDQISGLYIVTLLMTDLQFDTIAAIYENGMTPDQYAKAAGITTSEATAARNEVLERLRQPDFFKETTQKVLE